LLADSLAAAYLNELPAAPPFVNQPAHRLAKP
jgi:hypothetical protein